MNTKVGRNDPCPCGSGKKYKKCCLALQESDRRNDFETSGEFFHPDNPELAFLNADMTRRWSFKQVRTFATDDIIDKLRSLGVPFDEAQFLDDVKKYYSAQDLTEHWFAIHSITAKGFDQDFIWMGATELWNRLAPEIPNTETLYDMIHDSYALLPKDVTRACSVWLEVWKRVKPRFTENMKSLKEASKVLGDDVTLHNWCQDLEQELHNAGLDDPAFWEKRIEYCRDFCRLLPKTDELIIHNMRRAEAESCFALGRFEEGTSVMEKLIADFPDNPWGYIAWGDAYFMSIGKAKTDYNKAEQLYTRAFDKAVSKYDREAVAERLRDLEEERKGELPENETTG
ncbi:MAG: SEC-C domain-containing protein [Ignavibacteriae bacterium]|nr:SEC-C domain-containing protein [Ignavibacteriota bacterium]